MPESVAPGPPREASADSRAAARTIRDFFDGFLAEGFTERQAIEIIGKMFAANGGGGE